MHRIKIIILLILLFNQTNSFSARTDVGGGGSGSVSDTVYGAGWDGDTTVAPSKNAVYDKIETIATGGDNVSVNSTGATNANFLDNLYIDWAIDTAATPDDITSKFNYGETLAGNPALLTTECIFMADGLMCEGTTADTIEIKLAFPDPATTDKTITLPNATDTLVGKDTTDTLTNKTLAAANNVIDADTAVALAANGANCAASSFPLGVDASGAVESCSTSISGNAATATALAADPADCGANTFATTIVASGALTCAAIGDADVPNTITIDLATLATTATTANAGDSATSFFSSGTLEVGIGGTGTTTSTGTGAVVLGTSPTIATPAVTGKVDRNNVAVDDDDCTSEQGLYWYDTTDSAFEFCNANSGAPTVLGGGSGAPTDADYLVGTANGSLSAEIVVGTTPGGELGGTWGTPTVDDSLTVTGWVMGDSTATTPTAGDNDTSLATTAFVTTAVATPGYSIQLYPQSGKLPTSNTMAIDAGNSQWRGLFDATTDECVRWQGVLTPYNGGALQADLIYSMVSATSGTAALEVYVMCISGGDAADVDTDSFGTVDSLTGTVAGTAGYPALLTDTSLNGDTCAQDDLIIVKICRDADGSDTATGDLEFRGGSIHE